MLVGSGATYCSVLDETGRCSKICQFRLVIKHFYLEQLGRQ